MLNFQTKHFRTHTNSFITLHVANNLFNRVYLLSIFQSWKEAGVEFLQLATTDIFATPCQRKLIEGVTFINKFIKRDNIMNGVSTSSVYIHCKAGRTRSATLVGCYLIHVSTFSSKENHEVYVVYDICVVYDVCVVYDHMCGLRQSQTSENIVDN